MRAMTKIVCESAMPWTSAPTRKSAAAIIIVLRRPMRSARRPAKNAPMKQPMSKDATVKPSPLVGEKLPFTRPNVWIKPSCVPFTAPLS